MVPLLRQLQVLLLSLLFVWSGLAYAHHHESPEDFPAKAGMFPAKAVTQGDSGTHNACDECCHGGGHFETVCNDPAPVLPTARATLQSALTITPLSCALPPPTPPPQG